MYTVCELVYMCVRVPCLDVLSVFVLGYVCVCACMHMLHKCSEAFRNYKLFLGTAKLTKIPP